MASSTSTVVFSVIFPGLTTLYSIIYTKILCWGERDGAGIKWYKVASPTSTVVFQLFYLDRPLYRSFCLNEKLIDVGWTIEILHTIHTARLNKQRCSNFPSIKCFAIIYKAPAEKYWHEIIGETCFSKVDGVTCYGHSLKGTNGL